MPINTANIYIVSVTRGAKPEPIIEVSEWADTNRFLSEKVSSESGLWRTSRTPYLKEPMDALSPHSPYEIIVFQKPRQVGGTEAGNNALGCWIDVAPGPINYAMPTVETLKKNSKIRISTLFDDSPALRNKIIDPRKRDSGNTLFLKEFDGGYLNLIGANSAVSLRSVPSRYLMADEIDGWPYDVNGEGDPLSILLKSQDTYGSRKKAFLVSTPTIKGLSRIESYLERSDARKYFVPCLECGSFQILLFSNLVWEKGKPHTVYYKCSHCGSPMRNDDKQMMLEQGKWKPTRKSTNPKLVGFWLSSLYSPVGWFSWEQLIDEWEDAQGNPQKLKVVVNTRFAETWEEKGEAPPWRELFNRRESYPQNVIADGGLLLVAGCDVQKDRVEVEIVAYGRGKESWSIDYRVLPCDTSNIKSIRKVLNPLFDELFTTKSGHHLSLRLLGIDTGYNTTVIYEWGREMGSDRVMLLKGRDKINTILSRPSSVDINLAGGVIKKGAKLWGVGVNIVKSEIYAYLRLKKPKEGEEYPAGYIHFPEYDEEFFKQMTAEELVKRKTKKGYYIFEFQKIRTRNEALDCRVYARAASAFIGLDRFREKHWVEIESSLVRHTIKEVKPKNQRRVISKGIKIR